MSLVWFEAWVQLRAGVRTISTWCRACSAYREPVVDPLLWADIPFCLSSIPRVPPDSGETLRVPITEDDYQYLVGEVPNNKASPGKRRLLAAAVLIPLLFTSSQGHTTRALPLGMLAMIKLSFAIKIALFAKPLQLFARIFLFSSSRSRLSG